MAKVAISPDGSKVAIAGGEGARRTIEVRDVAKNSVLLKGEIPGDAVTTALEWAAPRHVLVVTTVNLGPARWEGPSATTS